MSVPDADLATLPAGASSLGDAAAIARLERELFAHDTEVVRVGRYEVIARVGAGGFGTVYRARDPELDRIVALKVLHAWRGRDQARRMAAEASAMAAVDHPNVAKVFDVGMVAGAEERAWVAMEWVDGPNLRQWLAVPRPRDEVVRTLVQIGRGLVAAHARGLVHGDVKPDNVLVARGPHVVDDDAVKVVDFGLARSLPDPAAVRSTEAAITDPAVAGTPAYLAPERRHGGSADAAADQFAFFVMVYEALHGARPFVGGTVAEVARAIEEGRAAPIARDLPRSLRRAIERGLARDPGRRHVDMESALRAMTARPRRGWLAFAGIGGGAVVAFATMAVLERAEATPCPDADALMQGVWDDARRTEVHGAFVSTARPYATHAWTRTATRLDGWVTRWRTALSQTCDTVESPAIAARRACLDERRAALQQLVEVLARVDGAIVDKAEILVDALPDPGACEALGDAATPEASAARAHAGALVVAANARYALGDYAAAANEAEAAARASADAGDRTLEATAIRLLGKTALARGDVEAGIREATRALVLAREAGDDRTTAELALDLAYAEGAVAGRAAAGADWLRQADAAIARVDAPVRLSAHRANVAATLRTSAGDAIGALAFARTAVELLATYDDEDPHLLEYEANAGVAAQLAGDPYAARAALKRTLVRMESRFGPGHPAALTLAGNLALPLFETGRFAEAEAVLARGLAASDARPFELVLNLAIAQQLRGRSSAAKRHFDEALTIAERQAAGAPLLPAQVLLNLADFAAREGDVGSARTAVARARVTIESALPSEHPVAAILLATECLVRARAGETDAAIELGRRALAIAEGVGDPRMLASVLLELGEAELAGDRSQAASTLARADAIAWPGRDPLLAARIRFGLARASSGERAPAIAKTALQRFPTDGDARERRAMAAFAATPR